MEQYSQEFLSLKYIGFDDEISFFIKEISPSSLPRQLMTSTLYYHVNKYVLRMRADRISSNIWKRYNVVRLKCNINDKSKINSHKCDFETNL